MNRVDSTIASNLRRFDRLHVILALIVALLPFLIFSFVDAFSFIFSYIVGFVIFYLLLKFKDVYIKKIFASIPNLVEKKENVFLDSQWAKLCCNICGGNKCLRYSNTGCQEPWVNISLHKQLDQAIENFFNAILNTYVVPWYSQVTQEETLVVELRYLFRYASSSLLNRVLKVDVGEIIAKKFVPCILRHYAVCNESRKLKESNKLKNLEESALNGPLKYSMHCALYSRECELEYLRCITEEIMPLLLPKQECDSKLFSTFIREIFAGWVLLSVTDILADPSIINSLIILATSDEKLSQLPDLPNDQVEFLKTFVKNDRYKRMRLLNMEVVEILKCPEYLYAFMQFMKANGKIHFLQFCLDLDDFNKKMLQPDINNSGKLALFKRADELYHTYFSHDSISFISFDTEYVTQFKKIINEGADNIVQLQTSKVLFEAYDHVFTLLDQEWAPKFFDSYEFYKLIITNVITEQKSERKIKTSNASPEKTSPSGIRLPLTKLKEAFKSQAVDGQFVDINELSPKSPDNDADDDDLEGAYSEIIAVYTRLKNKDMTTWNVSIENVIERKANNKTGFAHWFFINVYKIDPHGIDSDCQWTVERNDQDFQMLKEKLVEFHGENILLDTNLPPKRAKAAAEVRKNKYEVFLQTLLRMPVLKCSDLLHLFLTAESDFASLAREASTDSSTLQDLESAYQSVTHKLKKERGQHLDSLLQALLISTDIEYYQSLNEDKKQYSDNEDDAKDVMDDITLTQTERKITRHLTNSIFENNFNICDSQDVQTATSCVDDTFDWSISNCLHFILNEVFQVRHLIIQICNFLCQFGHLDAYIIPFINKALGGIFTQPRIGHLIKLGQDLLFENSIPPSLNMDNNVKLQVARSQLQNAFPPLFCKAMGSQYLENVDILFEYLQNPKLNKQLIYNLLDVLIMELFPELQNKL